MDGGIIEGAMKDDSPGEDDSCRVGCLPNRLGSGGAAVEGASSEDAGRMRAQCLDQATKEMNR